VKRVWGQKGRKESGKCVSQPKCSIVGELLHRNQAKRIVQKSADLARSEVKGKGVFQLGVGGL